MKYLVTLAILGASLLADQGITLEESFLQGLDEVSEIATKTKLNIDDSPSFITVLHSDKLQALGIDNVFEALAQVPGVQLAREASGVPVVIFRGVSQKGEVKLMIDGVAINNTYRGSIYHFLDFPIEMVERIEVIRGAGSVLYGSGAISGVINIITKSSDANTQNSVFVSGGTYNRNKGGAYVSTQVGDFTLALDGYNQKSDKMLDETDRALKDFSVGLNIKDEHFGLMARVKKSKTGNAYGILGVPDKDKDLYDNINNSFLTQFSYNNDLNKKNHIVVLAAYNKYEQYIESFYPGRTVPLIAPTLVSSTYQEESYSAQADLISQSLDDNELLIGVRYELDKTLTSYWTAAISSPYLPKYTSDPDASREILSLYLNDTYSVTSSLDVLAGLRYDNYSDFGDAYSPNLGLVYAINDKLRVKALYSRAFRAPSWVEITSADVNTKLEAEKSNSIETGFVYKQNQYNRFRLNFYATEIENMITKNGSRYIQNSKNNFYGTELEYNYSPNYQTEINLIASYIDAKDNDGNNLADIANILSSASLVYEIGSGFKFGSLLKYVSSSSRNDTDTRANMPYSLIFDETISYRFKNFTASLILKDLLDKGTYYALPQSTLGNDFYDGGRSFLLKASLEF
jgi:outer membrane receptor for ferrienterochelin and colicins